MTSLFLHICWFISHAWCHEIVHVVVQCLRRLPSVTSSSSHNFYTDCRHVDSLYQSSSSGDIQLCHNHAIFSLKIMVKTDHCRTIAIFRSLKAICGQTAANSECMDSYRMDNYSRSARSFKSTSYTIFQMNILISPVRLPQEKLRFPSFLPIFVNFTAEIIKHFNLIS